MTQLTHSEFFKVTLSDGTTNIVASTPGWGLAGLSTPRTSETADITGRGQHRIYTSTEVLDHTVAFSVTYRAETDSLLDEVTKTCTWERGYEGNASGKPKWSGSFIVQSAEVSDNGGVLMIDVSGQGTGAVAKGTF